MRKKLLLVVATTIIVCTVAWSAGRPLPSPDRSWEEAQLKAQDGSWEEAYLKVLKVFSARDGDAVFREYLVNWKDQEVIVRDPLVKTDYQVGETVKVLVMRVKYPQGKPGPDLLSFIVAAH